MEFHQPQKTIAKDRHRFRVVNCGRRFGKTLMAIYEMVAWATAQEDRKVSYIAPTYQQARDIAWEMLKKIADPITVNINESRLELTVKSQDGGKSHIYLRGWEAVETLRGQAFDFLVVDEIASMRNWQYNWNEVLRPTLTDKKGEALFISTPKGYNHFYDLYNMEKKDDDYKSFHFTSYDNPHLPHEEIDKAKKELTEDGFAQEYLADFRKAVGLAHKGWDREIHLVEDFEVPNTWQRARGFDYGSVHPTASVRVAISPDDVWFIERCYKEPDRVIEEHANSIKAQDYGFQFIPTYGDPSGGQWFKEFAKYGVNIERAKKENTSGVSWMQHGVEKVNQRLKAVTGHDLHIPNGEVIKNAPKMLVLDTEENLQFVKEIELLKWKENRDGENIPTLDENVDPEGHCDLLAALRYLVVSYDNLVSGTMSDSLAQHAAAFPRQDLSAYGINS